VAGSQPSKARTLRAVERLVTDSLPQGGRCGRLAGRVGDLACQTRCGASRRRMAPSPPSPWRSSGCSSGAKVGDALTELAASEAFPLVVAPYLGPTVRSSLADRGISFADTTGNLRLVADRPGLFVERQGASKDPWPPDDRLHSLKGRAAGRAVRALVDFRPPYGVRDLARRVGVSLGSLSRTLDLLDREGLVTRNDRGLRDRPRLGRGDPALEPGLRIRSVQPDRLLPRAPWTRRHCHQTLQSPLELRRHGRVCGPAVRPHRTGPAGSPLRRGLSAGGGTPRAVARRCRRQRDPRRSIRPRCPIVPAREGGSCLPF
jgi:DNA-binding transcriptional ArsR family regulator